MSLNLRKVRPDDKKLLFDWANDASTRESSFNTSQIPWTVHEKWFEERIQSNRTMIYVAQDEPGHDVGQIRFEKIKENAEAGFSIDEASRGKGFGAVLLDKGCEAIFAEWQDIDFVRAKVKNGNERSRRVCIKAGFEEEEMNGDAVVYRRWRSKEDRRE
jgi:UDP-2,4-diacetamido-2,4,6-trideoxy-beta-L-altropyranose hydrolase